MYNVDKNILKKHEVAVEAALRYYVQGLPTGLSDSDYDALERAAMEDGLSLRDYAAQFIQGQRSQNADYIGKVEKSQVTGIMSEALKAYQSEHQEIHHWLPKYDGSSLAIYYDPSSGRPYKVITVGGSNLGGEGIDQTEKFLRYLPDLPRTGIMSIQCECLIGLHHGLAEKSRQKANGLVNSSYQPLSFQEFKGGKGTDKEYAKYLQDFEENNLKVQSEIDQLITLRCFRYFLDPTHPSSQNTLSLGQQRVLGNMPVVLNSQGDIKFCGAFTFQNDHPSYIESDIWATPTGTFLVDGVVGYTFEGECVRALKYKDAGRGEATEVLGIQWNDQTSKGKDSWSANALINPITVRGTRITKPSVGSIRKMLDSGLSEGAKVTIILANSTIPQVSKVLVPGNLDFQWPTCSCGYKLGPSDIYGSLVKCGNPQCSNRESRMRKYLSGVPSWKDIDLTKLLVLDRWDWAKKTDTQRVLQDIYTIISSGQGEDALRTYLEGYLTTELLRRNLKLIIHPAYVTLKEYQLGHALV